QGQLIWGAHISLAPTWLDPAETSGIITPFMVLYALHDAMVKPMPGQALAASLAESWSAAEDGLSYDFVVRQGAKFHNGEPFTAGVELVLEAFEGYWRKVPSVKRIVIRSIPDESTRLAALKTGEVDIIYWITGELASELERTPSLTLKPVAVQTNFFLYFPE